MRNLSPIQEISWAGGVDSIRMLDLVRRVPTRFATGFEVFLPTWSPDSREILFSEGGDQGVRHSGANWSIA